MLEYFKSSQLLQFFLVVTLMSTLFTICRTRGRPSSGTSKIKSKSFGSGLTRCAKPSFMLAALTCTAVMSVRLGSTQTLPISCLRVSLASALMMSRELRLPVDPARNHTYAGRGGGRNCTIWIWLASKIIHQDQTATRLLCTRRHAR